MLQRNNSIALDDFQCFRDFTFYQNHLHKLYLIVFTKFSHFTVTYQCNVFNNSLTNYPNYLPIPMYQFLIIINICCITVKIIILNPFDDIIYLYIEITIQKGNFIFLGFLTVLPHRTSAILNFDKISYLYNIFLNAFRKNNLTQKKLRRGDEFFEQSTHSNFNDASDPFGVKYKNVSYIYIYQ